MTKSILFLSAAFVLLIGCSVQRSRMAEQAQTDLVGMSKKQILSCMGVPTQKAREDDVEIWVYSSGNGRVDAFAAGQSYGQATATVGGPQISVNGSASTFASSAASRRFCVVNVVMQKEIVSAINYSGPTGGMLTKGEQCAYAVENCLKKVD
ncbi:MAG: hypothetical protein IPI58_00460 [Alphaproteobacteria bacterium]|nr:MAG: hypothetical protein IPI58_00460 [Alphaproteobacteria bacterium]